MTNHPSCQQQLSILRLVLSTSQYKVDILLSKLSHLTLLVLVRV